MSLRAGLSQQTSLRQELRVNPRLYQAMDMLYMPMMDLQQHLKQELLANPFLELLEPEDEESAEQDKQQDQDKEKEQQQKNEEMDWEEILLNGFDVGGTREQFEVQEYTEPVTVETRNLTDHLRDQLQMMELSPRQRLLAEEFLGNMTEDGYLAASLEELIGSVNQMVASHFERPAEPDDPLDEMVGEAVPEAGSPATTLYTLAEAEEMLTTIQKLDPPGVGARDLRECLLIQLREAADTESLTYRLVADAFPDLIAHRWNDLAKRFGVEPGAVQSAADQLARFDPKPGLKYSDRRDGYIIPDLIVEKIGDRYHVFLNDTGMPRLRLSRAYQEVARDKKKLTQENREFIASKMNSANWMIQAIEQRRQTMLKVMNFIVDRQRDFFEKGIESSARSIRAKLEKMVGDENPSKPLTDQQIVHLFQEQGIQIARRTVAKYRDQLGILPARMRKRV